jgi:Acetyltransferase (GNAT) domain
MTGPTRTAGQLTATIQPIEDRSAIGRRWQDLLSRAPPETSFFLSWPWIGTWLAMLPAHSQPHLLAVQDPDRPDQDQGLAILCRRRHVRLGLLASWRWRLHEAGDPELDRLMIEYNGVLAEPGQAASVLRAGLEVLRELPSGCDELVLGGIDPAAADPSNVPDGWHARTSHMEACPYVDLGSVNAATGHGWPSRGPAAAIRRAERLYGATGELAFHIAETEPEAQAYLDGLIALHQQDWTQRGRPGAFASSVFTEFHRRLIKSAFSAGHIQLARLTVGDHAIGYLYNFIWRGTVYAYQSGFDRPRHDNRLKPGLLTHHAAILANARMGHRRYDFMAGEGRQKRAFATGEDQLAWMVLERDTLAKRIERWLRHVAVGLNPVLPRPFRWSQE